MELTTEMLILRELFQALEGNRQIMDGNRKIAEAVENILKLVEKTEERETNKKDKAIKWLMNYIIETVGKDPAGVLPNHDCEYLTNPEKGHCDFHYKWVDCMELLNEYC